MIEVFRTTVNDAYYARILIAKIERQCPGTRVNFDLSDCDRILRVTNARDIDPAAVITLVKQFGYHAEILPDLVNKRPFNSHFKDSLRPVTTP